MDDPDTARQNGAEGLERPEKLPATSGKRGQKIYGRDALTNGSKTLPDTDGRLRDRPAFSRYCQRRFG